MAHLSDPRGALGAESDRMTRAQAIFAAVGIGIIFGGLWFISESNAPYHPEVPVTGGELVIASDG